MKKIITWSVIAVMAFQAPNALAEGYQVNSLSAKQNGMGHTGTGLHLGAESMFYNPAGLGFMDNKIEFSGSLTAIFSNAYAKSGGREYATSSKASTPMNFMLGFNALKNLNFGVGFYTPYGSKINWGENWPGAVLNQSVKLQVMTVQPTVSYKILPNLSVGAGMTLSWGSVNLNKALLTGSSMDAMLATMGMPAQFNEISPASVNLSGSASARIGMNLGIMWDILPNLTVGFDYRSRVDMKVKAGTASVSYANDMARQLMESKAGLINGANFSAQMPCAAVYRLGVGYKPVKGLTLAFDAQLTGWSAYKNLDITFDLPTDAFNQHIEKNYKDSWLFMLGAQYELTKRFDVRAGLMVDTTPCNSDYYNPETPGMTKVEPSVGLSFRPIPCLSIDASFLYVKGMGAKNCTGHYEDMLTKTQQSFTADYNLHAVCPAIGFSLHF